MYKKWNHTKKLHNSHGFYSSIRNLNVNKIEKKKRASIFNLLKTEFLMKMIKEYFPKIYIPSDQTKEFIKIFEDEIL